MSADTFPRQPNGHIRIDRLTTVQARVLTKLREHQLNLEKRDNYPHADRLPREVREQVIGDTDAAFERFWADYRTWGTTAALKLDRMIRANWNYRLPAPDAPATTRPALWAYFED